LMLVKIDVSTFNDTKLSLFILKCKFFAQKNVSKNTVWAFLQSSGSKPKVNGVLNALTINTPRSHQ